MRMGQIRELGSDEQGDIVGESGNELAKAADKNHIPPHYLMSPELTLLCSSSIMSTLLIGCDATSLPSAKVVFSFPEHFSI